MIMKVSLWKNIYIYLVYITLSLQIKHTFSNIIFTINALNHGFTTSNKNINYILIFQLYIYIYKI